MWWKDISWKMGTSEEENKTKNYIVINGKKAELTEDQLKQLGIKAKRNNPFNSETCKGEEYYVISEFQVIPFYSSALSYDKRSCDYVNSFNDKDFAEQIRLHELLNRKLLKYAYDHEAEDCKWNREIRHYYIVRDRWGKFCVTSDMNFKSFSTTYFIMRGVAEQAIKDVIEPFIEEHSEFVW